MEEARGYGITKSDMAASRLVFVSVKDSQQRRKAAVPVPDGYTWEQFCDQVKSKLKLSGIRAILLASSGEKIASLEGLQDIDDLLVEEGVPSTPNGVVSTNSSLQNEAALRTGEDPSTSELHYTAAADGKQPSTLHRPQGGDGSRQYSGVNDSFSPRGSGDVDDEKKYIKRSNILKRIAQRIFPDAFVPSLPLTSRQSIGEDSRGRRRRKKGVMNRRNLMLLIAMVCSILTMFFFYWRMSPASG